MYACPECGKECKLPRSLGAHRAIKHGVKGSSHSNKYYKRKTQTHERGRDKDVGDALIAAFRQLLHEAENMHTLIRALTAQNKELGQALAESQGETKRLDRENADLRGRLLEARQKRDVYRKELRVTPLAERLKPEELAMLEKIARGEQS